MENDRKATGVVVVQIPRELDVNAGEARTTAIPTFTIKYSAPRGGKADFLGGRGPNCEEDEPQGKKSS